MGELRRALIWKRFNFNDARLSLSPFGLMRYLKTDARLLVRPSLKVGGVQKSGY
jgi:hypothetical protein